MTCPDCGTPVAPGAVVCPQCGLPLRKEALPRDAGPSAFASGDATPVILTAGAVGLVCLAVVGLLAAFGVPALTRPSTEQMRAEGEGLLERVFALETAYHARHGTYAAEMDALKSVGWREPETRGYRVGIGYADATELCIHVFPLPGNSLPPMRMEAAGERLDAGCGETIVVESVNNTATWTLGHLFAGAVAWRNAHGGRLPATVRELEAAYPAGERPEEYALGFSGAAPPGAFCVALAFRARPAERLLSIDARGIVHSGDGCTGERLHRFPTNPPPVAPR